jgi:hypothetical protein
MLGSIEELTRRHDAADRNAKGFALLTIEHPQCFMSISHAFSNC